MSRTPARSELARDVHHCIATLGNAPPSKSVRLTLGHLGAMYRALVAARRGPTSKRTPIVLVSEGRRRLPRELATRGMSRADLAALIRFSHPAISQWISGQRTPGRAARIAIARELNIDPSAWDREAS